LSRLAVPPIAKAFSSEVAAGSREENASIKRAPIDALEERRNLVTRAIWIFAMRKVSDAGKHPQIEICKSLVQAIGPA
jgi:hypothetical protein